MCGGCLFLLCVAVSELALFPKFICLFVCLLGIFSNVHMLALMYSGELCYWSWELAATIDDGASSVAAEQSKGKAKSSGKESSAENGVTTVSGATPPLSRLVELSISESGSCPPRDTPVDSLYLLMRHLQGDVFVRRWRSEFNAILLAQEFLSKYLETARGALKDQGWNYDRAVQLLVKLKRAKRPQ